MFPEVDAGFGQDDPPVVPGGDDTGSGAKRKKPAPNSGRGGGTGGSLTGEGLVCTNEEKAPRVGFEPTTYRLTAGRSTVELSGNASNRRKRLPCGDGAPEEPQEYPMNRGEKSPCGQAGSRGEKGSNRAGISLGTGMPPSPLPLLHQHPVPLLVVFDAGHERPHQHHTPTTGDVEALVGRAVGNLGRIETGPLVGDLHPHEFR